MLHDDTRRTGGVLLLIRRLQVQVLPWRLGIRQSLCSSAWLWAVLNEATPTSSDRRREVAADGLLTGLVVPGQKDGLAPVPPVPHRHAQEDLVLNPAVGAL
jgi:hypothetical protein